MDEVNNVTAKENDGNGKSLFSRLQSNEEDESHLPPALRKMNRCNSSSSEDEDSKVKEHRDGSASHSSDSDSDMEDKEKKTEKASRSPEPVKSKTNDAKSRHKKDRDSSHSRSRSRSPRRRRRRSSDRSRGSRSRSRSHERRHRRDKKRRSHRSRSRDRRRSRDRDHHKRRRDHRRSRSRERRDRRKRSRSRDRDRRDRRRSRSRDRRRRERSRSRSRSKTPDGSKIIKFGDKVIKAGASFGRPTSSNKPMTFKEKMRQQFIKAVEQGADVSTALISTDGTPLCTQTAGTQQTGLLPTPARPPVPLMAQIVPSTSSLAQATISASEAAMQSMLQLQKETTAKTGVEIPSYYNPGAINPVKYAEQVQKRKLLWSKNKEKDVNSQWHTSSLTADADDKSKEKFRKLMGIKGEGDAEDQEQDLKQREIFDQLDKEYNFARMATHTHRGLGLGFGSVGVPLSGPVGVPLSGPVPPTSQAPPPPSVSQAPHSTSS